MNGSSAGRTHLDLAIIRASAAWKGCDCLCARILLGTIREADGNTVCIGGSMWLSMPTSGKELTEGFNRARPPVQRGTVLLNWWKQVRDKKNELAGILIWDIWLISVFVLQDLWAGGGSPFHGHTGGCFVLARTEKRRSWLLQGWHRCPNFPLSVWMSMPFLKRDKWFRAARTSNASQLLHQLFASLGLDCIFALSVWLVWFYLW